MMQSLPLQVELNSNEQQQQLTRVGLVYFAERKPYFNHQSIAEFYLAQFLANQLDDVQLQEYLLERILLGCEYSTVRSFSNGLLLAKLLVFVTTSFFVTSFCEEFARNRQREEPL